MTPRLIDPDTNIGDSDNDSEIVDEVNSGQRIEKNDLLRASSEFFSSEVVRSTFLEGLKKFIKEVSTIPQVRNFMISCQDSLYLSLNYFVAHAQIRLSVGTRTEISKKWALS